MCDNGTACDFDHCFHFSTRACDLLTAADAGAASASASAASLFPALIAYINRRQLVREAYRMIFRAVGIAVRNEIDCLSYFQTKGNVSFAIRSDPLYQYRKKDASNSKGKAANVYQ